MTTPTFAAQEEYATPLSEVDMGSWLTLPAAQQPDWSDSPLVGEVRTHLSGLPGLVDRAEVLRLREMLAAVAAGQMHVVQAGDCAEDMAECVPSALTRKIGLLDALAGVMRLSTGKPVVKVGRIAGQFAKPRSQHTEVVGDQVLPVFRGQIVNDIAAEHVARRPDPLRMVRGYWAAREAVEFLRTQPSAAGAAPALWTSHEALLLDYEVPQVRADRAGGLLLTSTHWPWIGDRTRAIDGAHVRLLAAVANPVACKIGPSMRPAELVELCEVLDPERRPGRLTLIARMGAGLVACRLSALVEAVRAAGHPVIWMSDPMHGNTVVAPSRHKTRVVGQIVDEVIAFCAAVRAGGGVAGGLHLESTPDDVTECADTQADLGSVGDRYTSLCDPRLNPIQAMDVARQWNP